MEKITLKDLHDLNNKYPELSNYHLSHEYDHKTKSWKFQGYRCMKCGTILRRVGTVPTHHESCRYNYNRSLNVEERIDLQIITTNRKLWEPIDFNQKKSLQENTIIENTK